jgi:hypothetical protein
MKTMFLVERPAGARPVRVPMWSTAGVFVLLVTVPLIWPLGLQVQLVSRVARTAALALFP